MLLDFQFFEKLLENLTLSGLLGNDVPQMADLRLANAVDTTKALFETIRVPGEVVIDHQVGVLQVHAFACCIGGDQHKDIGVVAELLLNLSPLIAVGAAMNGHYSLGFAQHVPNSSNQVVQGIAVLGEDDQLAAAATAGEHLWSVLQQAGELLPLLVLA
ncbi:hypothetical protein D3C76_1041070 [compost metagenome]